MMLRVGLASLGSTSSPAARLAAMNSFAALRPIGLHALRPALSRAGLLAVTREDLAMLLH